MSDVQPEFIQWVSRVLDDPDITRFNLLQTLWSGYGQCFRFYSPRLQTNLVAKAISPPARPQHPKGWHTTDSHQRKLDSYAIEHHFYQHYPAKLTHSPVPVLLASDQHNHQRLLIMQDLDVLGYCARHTSLTLDQAQPVIAYLAGFHAALMDTHDTSLWQWGSYWHLPTRQQEWAAMPEGELKRQAAAIHQTLVRARFTTVIHGDAKVANFCFSEDGARVAAVDFQYPGRGTGVQDLAYFIGSALSDDEQLHGLNKCLDTYFTTLKQALAPQYCAQDVEREWRELYPFACADFQRFLSGWSPQHVKLNQALEAQTRLALTQLNCTPASNA